MFFQTLQHYFAVIVVKFLLGLEMVIVCLVLVIGKRKSEDCDFHNNNQVKFIFSYYFLFQFRDLTWLYIKIILSISKKYVIIVL